MTSIQIKGREIPLLYTVYEMKQIQEEIGMMNKAISLVTGRNPEDEDDTSKYGSPEHLAAMATMIRILGNAGLEEAGEKPDLTEKEIMRGLKPADLIISINTCLDAMNEGMASEIPKKEETGQVDVVLEEISKKKAKDD